AELQIGVASVRLDHSTTFDFLNLDDRLAQMEVTQGTIDLDLCRLRDNETYEVDTPTIAFIAGRVGDYRIDVDPKGGTIVSARRGGGDAVGEGGKRVTIEEGQAVRFNDSQLNDYQVNRIGPPTEFDNFVAEHEHCHGQPPRYVSQNMV